VQRIKNEYGRKQIMRQYEAKCGIDLEIKRRFCKVKKFSGCLDLLLGIKLGEIAPLAHFYTQ